MAPKAGTQTTTGTLALAAAGAWSSSKPLTPAASPDPGPSPQSGSTAHDQHPPLAIPPPLRPSDTNIWLVTPTLSRWQPSAPRCAAKTKTTRRPITLPFAAEATDRAVAVLARRPSQSEIEKSNQTSALNPHSPTPPLAQTPPRFPPSRLFRRLPPSPSSPPCPAGVRKPLTKADCRHLPKRRRVRCPIRIIRLSAGHRGRVRVARQWRTDG
jgi:hypothetical protein